MSEELKKKYEQCNEQLKASSQMVEKATNPVEMETAKDSYIMAALGMIMIQNHIIIEMMTEKEGRQ